MRRGVSPHVQPQVPPPLIVNVKTRNQGRLSLRLPGVQEHQPTHFKDRAEKERERVYNNTFAYIVETSTTSPHGTIRGPH